MPPIGLDDRCPRWPSRPVRSPLTAHLRSLASRSWLLGWVSSCDGLRHRSDSPAAAVLPHTGAAPCSAQSARHRRRAAEAGPNSCSKSGRGREADRRATKRPPGARRILGVVTRAPPIALAQTLGQVFVIRVFGLRRQGGAQRPPRRDAWPPGRCRRAARCSASIGVRTFTRARSSVRVCYSVSASIRLQTGRCSGSTIIPAALRSRSFWFGKGMMRRRRDPCSRPRSRPDRRQGPARKPWSMTRDQSSCFCHFDE